MPVNQYVQIDTFDYGASLSPVTLHALADDALITGGTAASCPELSVDSGTYRAVFTGAAPANLIPAGTYRIRTTVSGAPVKRFVTLAGVDGEVVYARSEEHAVLDTATFRAALGMAAADLDSQLDAILAGGGAGTVNVLPATGIVADRSAGTTLVPVVGETISQAITVYQSDGTTAVDLSAKSLKVIFETMSGTDVAVVLTADITISGTSSNVVTFAYPAAVTTSERVLRFAIRDAAAPLTMYLHGVCSVVRAPKVDA